MVESHPPTDTEIKAAYIAFCNADKWPDERGLDDMRAALVAFLEQRAETT